MARSKDCHSVVSSTESCETDLVLEQKALDRVITSRTSNRRTRRGTILSIGNRDEQPRKLHFRPGRVIEFKPEITSLPRRLKFKRRAPRSDSSQSKVEVTSGVLRKGGGRREGPPRRVEFMDTEKVVLRHQDMQGEKVLQASQNNVIEETASKLVEDRKSKVKALVGAFESLLTLQDSKPVPTISV
ncbi:unnamed protein product [Linum tenue]|uniref:Calmodulin-binding domain-containing protein n=1 Tax=Linum tenue TaxID=586396 RepID=A0AAV0RS49_9ROSI|nr:unnamed protein product [Linum tenue]